RAQSFTERFRYPFAFLCEHRLSVMTALLFWDYPKSRMNPEAGRSGTRNDVSRAPATQATRCAAAYPLRTAPSMVAGQPVAVQSPARKTRGQTVSEAGR